MTEKYKIYVSYELKKRLTYDAELFEFLKKDGSVNLNSFLKKLLINYFNIYQKNWDETRREIIIQLGDFAQINKDVANELLINIENKILHNYQKNSVNNDTTITLTVSGKSYSIIDTIQSNFLFKSSLSQYLRCMFESYLAIPRNEREKIIFKENFDIIEEAIKGKHILSIKTMLSGKTIKVYPYKYASSKEEQFNYLICYDIENDVVRSFRISRLSNILVRNGSVMLDKTIVEKLELSVCKSAQFSFESVPESCVKLSEEGMYKFRMIYTNRPEIERIENDCLYFKWPLLQLEEYFKKFGKDAVFIYPKKAREDMKKFYKEALEALDR